VQLGQIKKIKKIHIHFVSSEWKRGKKGGEKEERYMYSPKSAPLVVQPPGGEKKRGVKKRETISSLSHSI